MKQQGIGPTIRTYNSLIATIATYIQGNRLELTYQAFGAMQQQGITPDSVTYITMGNAHKRSKQPEEAMEIRASMQNCKGKRKVKSNSDVIDEITKMTELCDAMPSDGLISESK